MPLDSEDKLQSRRGTHPASLNSAVPLTGAANFANSVRCTFPASATWSHFSLLDSVPVSPSPGFPGDKGSCSFPTARRTRRTGLPPRPRAARRPPAAASSRKCVAWRGARSVSDAVGRATLHREGSGRLLRRSTVAWAARGALCVAGGRGLDARWRSSHGKRHLFVSIRGSRQAEAAPPHAGGPARPKVPSSALGCVPSDLPRGKDWHRMSPALPGSSLPP